MPRCDHVKRDSTAESTCLYHLLILMLTKKTRMSKLYHSRYFNETRSKLAHLDRERERGLDRKSK